MPSFHRLALISISLLCSAVLQAQHATEHDHDDHGHEEDHDHDHSGHDHDEGPLQIPPEVLEEFGIELGTVGNGILQETITLPGEIEFNRERLAVVTPRFAGTVTEIRARLAARVEKGEVLALLESNETFRPFELAAPFAGSVVEYEATPGQSVEAGSPLFTIADLSTLWADLRIYQRDMAKVLEGQSVQIEAGHDQPPYHGRIVYISPTIDRHTRTGLARVIIENTDGRWRPGQFVRGIVEVEEHAAERVVPRTSILSLEGEVVVFVKTPDGLEPRPVRLGHGDSTHVEVIEGLEVGDVIVTRNAISLKAEMGKAHFGGHEGHAH